jgi:sulfofructose kinase
LSPVILPRMSTTPGSCAAQWDVLGIGANSVDTVSLVPAFPRPEGWLSKLRISRHLTCCGGQTATTLAACAGFGLRAKYIGAVGADENGRRVRDALSRRQVDVAGVVVRDAPNQFALIVIDEQTGERAVLWDRDDRLRLNDDELPHDELGAVRLLHVDDVDQEAAIRVARLGRDRGVPVTSDLDRMTDRSEELALSVSVPIFAEGLPEQLTGERDPERALRKLQERRQAARVAGSPDGPLCVTLGARGAAALDGDRFVVAPAFPVGAVDTTGSGDVFRGGFIFGLLRGWDIGRTLRFANAAAGLACTRIGAMDGVPSLADALALAGLEV